MRRMYAKEYPFGRIVGTIFTEEHSFPLGRALLMKLPASELIHEIQGGKECRSKGKKSFAICE